MFIAPVVAAGISAAVGAGAIGSALISAGVSAAFGFAARALAPKPQQTSMGARLSVRLEPNSTRMCVFGETAVAGTLEYATTFLENKYAQLVFALADHECDSLRSVIVDGRTLSWDPETGNVAGYGNALNVQFFTGAYGQAASSELINRGGGSWTSNDRGRGVCYVVVTLKYDEKLFPQGQPRLLFVIRGAKLYDWRQDSTNGGSGSQRWGTSSTYTWTANPVVIAYNWRRGLWLNGQRIHGMNTPVAALPVSEWTAAANACDETVARKAGGTDKRYECHLELATSRAHRSVLQAIYLTMAGREIDTGGVLIPLPGVSQASVMSLTDDDLKASQPVEIRQYKSRANLINAIFGTVEDPAQQYEPAALPPRLSPEDEEADGGVRLEQHYALEGVTNPRQGQRICEIIRRRERRQLTVRATFRARMGVLEAGDWITWTSARYGWINQTFEIVSSVRGDDWSVTLMLRQTDANVYAWTAGTDELDADDPAPLPSGGIGLATIAGLAVENVTVASAGTAQRPGLHVTWTPPDDASVVAIDIEYRREGDTVALKKRIQDPASGSYIFVDGLQGSTIYQVRALPVVAPDRNGLEWTAWVEPPSAGIAQIVEISALATAVPTDTITPEMLSAQARFELSLITAVDEVFGSVRQQITDTRAMVQRVADAAIKAQIAGAGTRASVRTETIERVTETTALAQQITTVETALDGNVAQVIELSQSVDGIRGKWGVAINVNGAILGLVQMDADAVAGSTFTVEAGAFHVSLTGTSGGTAVPVFAISTVDGVAKLALRGDMYADGAIVGRMIQANSITANQLAADAIKTQVITDPTNTFRIDMVNGQFERVDDTMVLDLKNKIFDVIF